ncbi:MAG: hypothetical protein JW703_00380 [Candidatus Diapherotrites archaeon]|nr:hypothetical protein [Candidatus Diapherotrites archaeon]
MYKKIFFLGLIFLIFFGCVNSGNESNNNTINEVNNAENLENVIENPEDILPENTINENTEENNETVIENTELNENENNPEENEINNEEENGSDDSGYMGALPDLVAKTLILKSNSKAGDERAEFTFVVTNSSPVPISLNDNSIVIKLIDIDNNQEIASFKDGPYIELTRFLANGRMAYPLTTIKNPEFLKTPGIKRLKGIADYTNDVEEKNEENNEVIYEIEIKE